MKRCGAVGDELGAREACENGVDERISRVPDLVMGVYEDLCNGKEGEYDDVFDFGKLAEVVRCGVFMGDGEYGGDDAYDGRCEVYALFACGCFGEEPP